MNIFHQTFSTGEVVTAAGVSNAALQSWLKRGIIIGHKDKPIEGAGSPGAHRRFSFFNVMEIAIAKALLDAGMGEPREAFNAAVHFAHVGCGAIPGISPIRDPSLPFDPSTNAYTLMCVHKGRTNIVPYRPKQDAMAGIMHDVRIHGSDGLVLLFVDPVFERVVTALRHHPQEVLDLAYGRGGNQ